MLSVPSSLSSVAVVSPVADCTSPRSVDAAVSAWEAELRGACFLTFLGPLPVPRVIFPGPNSLSSRCLNSPTFDQRASVCMG
ncbi:hypothetical protein BV20DRAFT_975187 [Pilatotrama ljubarskyi]|nr:hypothetical protein BV20DRAFT_975187 [Pilatotrama ljubarskyi]